MLAAVDRVIYLRTVLIVDMVTMVNYILTHR